MDVNDYLDDPDPPVRRATTARRATPAPPAPPRHRQQPPPANHHEYVSQEIHDRRRVNDVAHQARREFEDDEFLVDEYDEPPVSTEKKKRGWFGRKPTTSQTQPVLHPTKPKRDFFQVVIMFALAIGVIALSAWQAWTVTSINAGALSIKWVHVSQAMIALQVLVLFFIIDLKK